MACGLDAVEKKRIAMVQPMKYPSIEGTEWEKNVDACSSLETDLVFVFQFCS